MVPSPKIWNGLFSTDSKLKDIIGLECLDTTNVVNMSNVFYGCNQLKKIDLSNFNTLNVTNMNRMFWGCSSLEELNIEKFQTSKVVDMGAMFSFLGESTSSGCELKFSSSFDTSNVSNMDSMFQQIKVKSLDLTSFTFKENLNLKNIFAYITSDVTVYVKDETMQQFVINARGNNVWSTNNVIIK